MAMISLIHPSRGRPQKCFETAKEWIEKAGVYVDYLCSIDNDDPTFKQYFKDKTINREGFILHSDNRSVVEATNAAAKAVLGDILVYLSDDFKAPDNWGKLILKEFEGCATPRLIKVDDCLQKFAVPVLTIPIMNRALYERLGYFFHPEYKSMHVDCDLYETVKRLGALKLCPHLKFPHEHVSIGKAPMDETYRRSSAHWDQGLEVFRRRQKLNFPA